jgi:hypothetical protein
MNYTKQKWVAGKLLGGSIMTVQICSTLSLDKEQWTGKEGMDGRDLERPHVLFLIVNGGKQRK